MLWTELPALSEEPRDARGRWQETSDTTPDQAIYRLGLSALDVVGRPAEVRVDDVLVTFVKGPIRAQVTQMRQRQGLPVRFDKVMTRPEFADGELVALATITSGPPSDLDEALTRWRQRALAATGLLAAVLDERIAGRELFEDVLLFQQGEFVGAADRQERVRTYLPFEVHTADAAALNQLANVSLDESSDAARAARLYRRAALEGPTADAFSLLWMAAECFSRHGTPSKKDIEAALNSAGMDAEGLPVSVGRLIGLRGDVQHRGLDESDERLSVAFYEMEAIVRCLIRQDASVRGGWWFASDNPGAFAEPFAAAVARLTGPGTTQWHVDRLPPASEATSQRIPRVVANPADDSRLDIDPGFGDLRDFIASVLVHAIEWIDPDATLAVTTLRPDDAPQEVHCGANASRIWIDHHVFEGVDIEEGEGLGRFTWDLLGLAGYLMAQQSGIENSGAGEALVEAVGAWLQYTRMVEFGVLPAEWLVIPPGTSEVELGKVAGWAAAGDARARAQLDAYRGEARKLALALHDSLVEQPLCPALALVEREDVGPAATRTNRPERRGWDSNPRGR